MTLLERWAPRVVAAGLKGYEEPPAAEKLSLATLRKDDDDLAELDFAAAAEDPALIEALALTYQTGAQDAVAMLGLDLTAPSAPAQAFARTRAAELVGMKRLSDGTLVVNADPRYAITETIRESARSMVARAVDDGWSYSRLSAELQGIFEESRAEMIARTELGFSYNNGAADIYEENGTDLVYVLDGAGCLPLGHDDDAPEPEGDVGVVDLDSQANGQIWPVAAMRQYPLGHPHCLPGWQMVLAPNLAATFSRWFEGELIILSTAQDDQLACTPNHPVLTSNGWMPAALVREGDYVARCLDAERMAILLDPDDHHIPTMIEQIVRAAIMPGLPSARTVPVSAEDFHGDGFHGDVQIVDIDRPTAGAVQAIAFKHSLEADFGLGAVRLRRLASKGASAEIHLGLSTPADRIMGGRRSLSASFCPDARQVELHALALRPQPQSRTPERTSYSATVDAETRGDRIAALAGLIALVEVRKIERQPSYIGHVYNLETRQGWYIAGNILTHNCVRSFPAYEGPAKEEAV